MKLVILFGSFVLYTVNAQLMHGALKDEILNELMSEMEVMKQDILVGLKNEMHEHHHGSSRMVSGDPLVGDVPEDGDSDEGVEETGGGVELLSSPSSRLPQTVRQAPQLSPHPGPLLPPPGPPPAGDRPRHPLAGGLGGGGVVWCGVPEERDGYVEQKVLCHVQGRCSPPASVWL